MKKNSRLAFLFLFILTSSEASAGDAFIDRDGRTFDVAIDGIATTRIADRDIKDSVGVTPYTVQWNAKVGKGPRCFRLNPTDARLGEPEKIELLIHEVRSDRPYNSWRKYSAVPSTSLNTRSFLSGNGFCASEYTLTERLRYPSLPAGQYIAIISFWGKGNWDRQTILLTVEQSAAEIGESQATNATATQNIAPADCTIVYAAKQMMALHKQLEDKVATGELTSDVFSSFGKETQDFGTLYTSDLPEACRRLEKIKNKWQLK